MPQDPSSMLLAGQTDVGRHRKDNQDTFISTPLWGESDALLAVIDGVGGYAGGAQAAALAKESIEQYMASPTGDTLTMLREAVVFANNQIVRERQRNPSLAWMCCVLTTAVADVATQKLLYVHVGDTRLYRLRNSELTKLTHDHSLVGVREDAGQLTEREAMSHPRRNEILRDVGSMPHRIDDSEFMESGETDFLPGDKLLLCSDGLTDMITRAQITKVLTKGSAPEQQVTKLIECANKAGGNDNITVVLAHFPVREKKQPSVLAATAETPVFSEPDLTPKVTAERPDIIPPDKTPVGTKLAAEAKPKKPIGRTWLGALMGLIAGGLVASIVWWQYAPARPDPANERLPAERAAPVVTTADTVRGIRPDSAKKSPVLKRTDTLQSL